MSVTFDGSKIWVVGGQDPLEVCEIDDRGTVACVEKNPSINEYYENPALFVVDGDYYKCA